MRQSKGQRGPEHVTNNYCCSDEVGGQSWSRSHKNTLYDLVKIEESHKQSHKLNGIGVGRSRMFLYLLNLFMTL